MKKYDGETHGDNLPFWQRLKIMWDFTGPIKLIWLTGYLIITWEHDEVYDFWDTLNFAFYPSGSYE